MLRRTIRAIPPHHPPLLRLRRSLSSLSSLSAYRRFGHLEADVFPVLDPAVHGGGPSRAPAPELDEAGRDEALDAVYGRGSKVGVEFEHCFTAEERAWVARRVEVDGALRRPLDPGEARTAATLLVRAQALEDFLARKFPTLKRYSGEGTESLLAGVWAACGAAAAAAAAAASAPSTTTSSSSPPVDVVIGQAHRGRLALLVALLRYPARKLFWKLLGSDDLPLSVPGLDDVNSHIAHTAELVVGSGPAGTARVSLLPNPSHLEAVNPVAAGKTRAKQDAASSSASPSPSSSALCLLIHGDAAVSGQGIVYECGAMGATEGFSVGGTVHIVTNNLLGFTANARTGRSGGYASDFAKLIGAPVFHANAEDLAAVVNACRLAAEFRAAFGRDAVVDLLGYRRHGHNEVDEPSFTNPGLYAAIRARTGFAAACGDAVLGAAGRAGVEAAAVKYFESEYAFAAAGAAGAAGFSALDGSLGGPATPASRARGNGEVVADGSAFAGKWAGLRLASAEDGWGPLPDARAPPPPQPATGVDVERLREVALASVRLPDGFRAHDRLVRSHVQARRDAVSVASASAGVPAPAQQQRQPRRTIDWATGEAMAFGTLLQEGYGVRLTGQDVERGTFSQRHAVLVDQQTGEKALPLAALARNGGGGSGGGSAGGRRLHVHSSLLSEAGVVGFELGYSWEDPGTLVLWEAQFGDFANCAQVLLDTFVTSGETKWLRSSGLTMLLPHGYDGAGPEHSSARVERFLQMVNSQAWAGGERERERDGAAAPALVAKEDKSASEPLNFGVAWPSTPANYFHLLRRQLLRPFRKPLVVLTPKTLLRLPEAASALADMGEGTRFRPVLVNDGEEEGGGERPAAAAAAGAAAATAAAQSKVTRAVLCSGKLFYELREARARLPRPETVALVRVEELAPWPAAELARALARFPSLATVVWAQEEPANMGAWVWAERHLRAAGVGGVVFAGRPALAAPAAGLARRAKGEGEGVVRRALGV
jgi:2-oxoglutarate dehydrogenase complex dehydrogenase (E1) component-like enzyme